MPVITLKPASGSVVQLDVPNPATIQNTVNSLRPFLSLNQRDGIVISEYIGDPQSTLDEDNTYHYLTISFRDMIPRIQKDFSKTVTVEAVGRGSLDLVPFVTNSFSYLEDHFFHILPAQCEVQYVDRHYYESCLNQRMTDLEKYVRQPDESSNDENIFDALVNLYLMYTSMYGM